MLKYAGRILWRKSLMESSKLSAIRTDKLKWYARSNDVAPHFQTGFWWLARSFWNDSKRDKDLSSGNAGYFWLAPSMFKINLCKWSIATAKKSLQPAPMQITMNWNRHPFSNSI